MLKKMVCLASACIGSMLLAVIPLTAGLAAQDEVPKDILASQIKRQGYACDRPEKAKRDAALSKPDSAVWILKCESGAYRVRVVPDMGAHVQRID
jgi:hypothetical protein